MSKTKNKKHVRFFRFSQKRWATYCFLCKRWLRGHAGQGYASHTKGEEHKANVAKVDEEREKNCLRDAAGNRLGKVTRVSERRNPKRGMKNAFSSYNVERKSTSGIAQSLFTSGIHPAFIIFQVFLKNWQGR